MTNKLIIQCIFIKRSSIQVYFIAFLVYLLRKTRENPGRNKDSGNKDLGRNRGRCTEYTPLFNYLSTLRIYMVCISFLLKIPLYQRFHTFFGRFHTFNSHLKIFNLDQKARLFNCYNNIYGLHGFSYENYSISTISHLFWAFSHL